MSNGTVLLVGSNASQIEVTGGIQRPTGYYLNELAVPTMAVLDAGYDVVLTTPNGTKPVLDETSRIAAHFGGSKQRLQAAVDFVEKNPIMQSPLTLRSVIDDGLDRFAALFVPGGQAPVVDLMQDATLGEILRHFHERKKPTALLCHGPIATISAMSLAKEFRSALVRGDTAKARACAVDWPYKDYQMTIFSNPEEKWLEDSVLHAKMYFHVVDALEAAGAQVSTTARAFDPHVIEDRELITGQNPASDHALAALLLGALYRERADASTITERNQAAPSVGAAP